MNLYFLSQLISSDGLFLTTRQDLNLLKLGVLKGPTPRWFKSLESSTLISPTTSRRLLPKYQSPQMSLDNANLLTINLTNRSSKFVAVWNKPMGGVIYGRIIGHINEYIIVEHWINVLTTDLISPSQQPNHVTQYSGCPHHEQFYNTHRKSFCIRQTSSCYNRYYKSTAMYIPNARHIQNSISYNLACSTFLVKQ